MPGESPLVHACSDSSDAGAALNTPSTSREDAVKLISSSSPLTHSRWTRGRAVTGLQWSSSGPTVLLASYGKPNQAPGGPVSGQIDGDGLVCVWDVERSELDRELVHTAPLTALAPPHPLSPAMILAGSAYGDLVAWDTRSRMKSAAFRSESSSTATIRSLACADSSSPFIISAACDGVVSAWSLSQVSTPVESTTVRERGLRDVRVSAMAIPSSAVFQRTPGTGALGKRSAVLVGGEDGGIYRVENAEQQWTTRHAGARHDSPVSGLSCHPGTSRFPQLGDLAASTSIDGSVGLWSFGRRGAGLRIMKVGSGANGSTTDVQWAPSHPGVVAVCDTEGGIEIIDVSRAENDMSLGRYTASPNSTVNVAPLNRLRWNNEGSCIACGATDGSIHLWSTADAIRNPEDSAWESVSSSAKQWRSREGSALGSDVELPSPSSYVFRAVPPVFNPLAS